MQNPSRTRIVGLVAAITAVATPIASHAALGFGRFQGAALALAALQDLATGTLLWTALPRRLRPLGPAAAAILLAALAAGARHGPEVALLAQSGAAHALLYAALATTFAATLRPGRTPLVTWFASRINPGFRPAMRPYTRAVTWAWTLLFAAELAASALLLTLAPQAWPAFVTLYHPLPVIALALSELALRHLLWRNDTPTGLVDTIAGVRRLVRQSASSSINR